MKKLVILCTVILFVLLPAALVVSCQQPAPSPTPAPAPSPTPTPAPSPPKPAIESLTYTNSEYGFSLEYPKDWDFEEGLMGTIVLFVGPFVEEEEFMINMNIMSEELLEFPKITLEDYAKIGEMGIRKMVENYKKIAEHSATIGDLPAIVLTYTAGSGVDMLMYSQAFFLEENVAYVISYAAPPEFHDEYVKSFELVISTFELK